MENNTGNEKIDKKQFAIPTMITDTLYKRGHSLGNDVQANSKVKKTPDIQNQKRIFQKTCLFVTYLFVGSSEVLSYDYETCNQIHYLI